MDKFNQIDYIKKYNKDNYTNCSIRIKQDIADIIAEFSANLGISKAALIQKCVVYCYEEMIDVSSVKLSTPDKSGKSQD